jgi:hypothetical protein
MVFYNKIKSHHASGDYGNHATLWNSSKPLSGIIIPDDKYLLLTYYVTAFIIFQIPMYYRSRVNNLKYI